MRKTVDRLWAAAWLGVSSVVSVVLAATQVLPPEQVFHPSMRIVDGQTLAVDFRVEPGYYLYRQRFAFELAQPQSGVRVGPAVFPVGSTHTDEFFGTSEVFRNQLTITLPITLSGAKTGGADLIVHYQGCADAGICYPPQTYRIPLAIADGTLLRTTPGASQLRGADLLSASEAPPLSSSPVQPLPLLNTPSTATKNVVAKAAKQHQARGAPSSTTADRASTMAAPATSNVGVAVQSADSSSAMAPATSATPATSNLGMPMQGADNSGNQVSQIADALKNKNPALVLLLFLVSGVLLTFTPCVLPMVPILSGIIVGPGKNLSRRRALLWSGLYVLGMVLIFTLLGYTAGKIGSWLTVWMQQPVVLVVFALLYTVLALSLFGLFPMQLPARWQSAAASHGGGSAANVFLMGALSALVVGPCLSPPLAGAILFIAANGHGWFGAAALALLALGMGLPVLLAAMAAHSLLPKQGNWMMRIQQFFGYLLLALAWWTVSPLLPAAVLLIGWALLLIILAVFLHALDRLPDHASALVRLGKAFGVFAFVIAVLLLVGAASGSRSVLQPLSGLRAAQQAASPVSFQTVRDAADLHTRLAMAGRPSMVDFYAEWCAACKELEAFTFTDPQVISYLQRLHLVRVDITNYTVADRELLRSLHVIAPPTLLFYDAQGRPLTALTVVGFQNSEQFLKTLRQIPFS